MPTSCQNSIARWSDTSIVQSASSGASLRLRFFREALSLSGRRICFLILLFVCALGLQAAEPRRVILLQSFGREFDPFTTFTSQFRQELAQLSPEPIDFFDVSLVSA